jgi:Zn-dependent peptidase ImmA (M78 family)
MPSNTKGAIMSIGFSEELSIIAKFKESAPVDVNGLAKALGINFSVTRMDEHLFGAIRKTGGDRYEIAISDADSEHRQRFTMAHLLGHYYWHREMVDDVLYLDRNYNSAFCGGRWNAAIGPSERTTANRFAVETLMPAALVKRIVREKNTDDPKTIAAALNVSTPIMEIRLKSLLKERQEGA